MLPRIVDIARKAEVSPSAVSLALNNKPGISPEVRQKIFNIARQMGYKTFNGDKYHLINENITIRLLKIAKHGHIVNERHNPFITEYMEGIETESKKRKYKLEVSFFDKIPIDEIVSSQKDITVNGLIILGTELSAHELNFFTELTTPIVFLDTYFPLSVYDCIDIDNADGVFRAIQHFYTNGHRSIGLVKSSIETRNFKMREHGFIESMEYFSLPVKKEFISSVDPAFDRSINDFGKFLDKSTSLPTAFFCMNDMIALGCMKALQKHNYKIPDDVSIIGFDDLPSGSLAEPPLTSIRVSHHQIGRRAVERLAEKIISPGDNLPENILIPNKLIIRDSVRRL
jgi:LacI family transcriptional regulator